MQISRASDRRRRINDLAAIIQRGIKRSWCLATRVIRAFTLGHVTIYRLRRASSADHDDRRKRVEEIALLRACVRL